MNSMITLEKPYLTSTDVYIFSIEGITKDNEAGDMTYKQPQKVIITFDNGTLMDYDYEGINATDVPTETWLELQSVIWDKIKELKSNYNDLQTDS